MGKRNIFLSISFILLFSISAFSQTLQEAINAKENERFELAKSKLLAMVSNPPSAEVFYQLGVIYAELDKRDSSQYFFNKAIEVFPVDPLSTACIGLAIIQGEYKVIVMGKTINPSKEVLNALITKNPKNPKLLNQIAEACLAIDEKMVDYAIELLNKSESLDRKNENTCILLGEAYLIKIDGSSAIANYNKALTLNPKNVKAQLSVGRIYAQAKNNDAALNTYNEVLTTNPDYAPTYKHIGELYYQKRQFDKAVENYEKYISMTERNVANLSRLASFLFLAKDYNRAIEVINEVIKSDSSNTILSRLIGYSYYEQQQYQKAREFMEKFFHEMDTNKIIASDYEYLAKSLYKTGQDSLAVLNFKKSIEKDTTQVELLTDLGDVYRHWRKYGQAAVVFSQKIQKVKNPSAIDYFNLGQSYYFDQQYGKADTAFTKVTELKPNAAVGYFWRGRTNAVDLEKNLEQAKVNYEKYIELASADAKSSKKDLAEAYGFMGYYSIQKDDNVAAKTFYKKVLELDPKNKQAEEVLKSIP